MRVRCSRLPILWRAALAACLASSTFAPDPHLFSHPAAPRLASEFDWDLRLDFSGFLDLIGTRILARHPRVFLYRETSDQCPGGFKLLSLTRTEFSSAFTSYCSLSRMPW